MEEAKNHLDDECGKCFDLPGGESAFLWAVIMMEKRENANNLEILTMQCDQLSCPVLGLLWAFSSR